MRVIVWKWKANVEEWRNKPGVIGIGITVWTKKDRATYGRSGWVGIEEEVKKDEEYRKV